MSIEETNSTGSPAPSGYLFETYTDRERLFDQFQLFSGEFNRCFDRALEIAQLSRDPATASWRLLDAGCGEGLYTGELITRYPHCRIVGIDKDPEGVMTGNMVFSSKGDAHFFEHDLLLPFPAEFDEKHQGGPESFDIAIAIMVLLHLRQPEIALANIFTALKPGGTIYIRNTAIEAPAFPHPSFTALYDAMCIFFKKVTPANIARKQEEYLRGAGFVDIETSSKKYTIGGPTLEGKLMLKNLVAVMEAVRFSLVKMGVLSDEEFGEHIRKLKTENNETMEAEWELFDGIGRKPGR